MKSLGYEDEKRINEEELYPIENESDMRQITHRSIGALSFLTPEKKMAVGSGVLISRDLILTAAHNLYDKDLRKENEEFKFYLGACGTAEKYYELEDWRYLTEFSTCPTNERLEFDYALIKLKQPIEYKEYLELSFPCDTCLMNSNKQTYLSIFGYPKYGQNYQPLNKKGEKIKLRQFGLQKKNRIIVLEPQNYKIGYAISTTGGQSGCPIVFDEKIIAIHNGGGKQKQNFNIGRLISPDLVFNLQKWCKQLKGSQFGINKQNLCPHLLNKLFEAYIQNSQLKKDKGSIEAKPLEAINTFKKSEGGLKLSKVVSGSVKAQFKAGLNYNEKLSPKTELQKSLTVMQATSKKKVQEQVNQIEAELHPKREELLQLAQKIFEKGKVEFHQDSDSALNYFDQCLQIQIEAVGKGGRETTKTLYWIGTTYYYLKNNHTKAIEYYKQYISIKEKYQEERDRLYMETLSSLGHSYQELQVNIKSGGEYFEQRLLHHQRIQYQKGAKCCASWLVKNSIFLGMSQRAEELKQKYNI